jgi:drug/metabolite transporter (DMT)-like permease
MTFLVWLFVCAVWSTVWLFIKLGVTDVPPLAFAATRLAIAIAVLAPLALRHRAAVSVDRGDRNLIVTTGVMLFAVNYGLLYWGARYVASGLMAVLQSTTPAFALLIGHRLLPDDERITPANSIGLLMGIGGVGLIFADRLQVSGPLTMLACGAIVLSAAVVAWAYVLVRARGSHLPNTTIMAGQLLCGFVPLSLVSLALEGSPLAMPWTRTAIVSAIYLALAGSVLAFWLNYWLMKRIGPTRMLLTSILEPLLAVILGAAVLGEKLSPYLGTGGVLILASVALVMRRARASE